jgi:hypothetical protein
MNPATDVGKRDLPPGLRSRLTEMYVDELHETPDLEMLVAEYMRRMGPVNNKVLYGRRLGGGGGLGAGTHDQSFSSVPCLGCRRSRLW